MFCPKCGTQNNDNNINCANCGAPMRPAQQPQYSYVQPQPQYGAPARAGAKPTVLYIIAGVMAALQVLMFFLPHLTVKGAGAYIPIQIMTDGKKIFGLIDKDLTKVVEGFMFFFIMLVVIELAWAVLSFLQKKPAGILGVVACAFGFFIHMIWMIFMLAYGTEISINMTPFPVFMFLISIGGIPVSIIQIVKSKYLA